jgi:hypothetical protein
MECSRKGVMKIESSESSNHLRKKPTLIFHIGGSKCGSSALQTFLTQNSGLKGLDGEIFEYWTVRSHKNGKLEPLFAPVFSKNNLKGILYEVSNTFGEEFKSQCIHSLFERFVLENDAGENKVFIFSAERWSYDFQNIEIMKCECKVKNFEIIVYLNVRPQIDLLIPAYLQWIIWDENPTLENTFQWITERANWELQFRNAHKLGADKVDIRYTTNIVEDFCNLYKIERSSCKQPISRKINVSLPIEAISLLTRNRVIRPGPHDSGVDFLIEDYIAEYKIPTKQVVAKISPELMGAVDDYFRTGNLKLFDTMDEDQISAFKLKSLAAMNRVSVGIEVEDLFSNHLTIEFLEPLCVGLLADFQKFSRERDQALIARDQIEKSRIWRFSRGYRFFRNLSRELKINNRTVLTSKRQY